MTSSGSSIRSSAAARGSLLALALLLAAGCRQPPREAPAPPRPNPSAAPSTTPDPRFHLGSHTRKVSTSSPEAQRAFDRGLILAFAFNHGASEREFRKSAELDPACAMAWWGIALVNGPHINNAAMTPEQGKTAWEALSQARQREASASPVEKALIAALAHRYAETPPEDRKALDQAYADAMREAWRAYPADADVGTLFAEAAMDLRPWDLWTPEGKPQPGTGEVLATLERVMEIAPQHAGANHLYIHASEGSLHPEKATAAADRLRDLVPGAGHLVHMPAHIYVRIGRWADAATANRKAIEADRVFRASAPNPGFYTIYMAHNHSFLSFTQMMEGRSGEALAAARAMVAEMPEDFLREFAPVADFGTTLPVAALMRFGKWPEILAEPEPPEDFPVARAMRLFARAAALNALGRLEEAEKERAAFRAAAAAVPAEGVAGNNRAEDVLAIAGHVLDGEIAARQERLDQAIRSLTEAARLEDRLKYDEPPDWIQPVRHTLGAVLLRSGRFAAAEKAYREDLARFPENGWSLYGLLRALRLQKKDAEAAAVEERFNRAWSGADVKIGSTCLCQPPV